MLTVKHPELLESAFRGVFEDDLGTQVRRSINVLGYIATAAEHQRASEEFGRCPGIETPPKCGHVLKSCRQHQFWEKAVSYLSLAACPQNPTATSLHFSSNAHFSQPLRLTKICRKCGFPETFSRDPFDIDVFRDLFCIKDASRIFRRQHHECG